MHTPPTSVLVVAFFLCKLPNFFVNFVIRFIENKIIPLYELLTDKKVEKSNLDLGNVLLTRIYHELTTVTWVLKPEHVDHSIQDEDEDESDEEGTDLDLGATEFMVVNVLATKDPTSLYNIEVMIKSVDDHEEPKRVPLAEFLVMFSAKEGEIRFFDA